MKIYDKLEQGSLEWIALRAGKVTASEMDALITPLWKIREGEGPFTYLCTKLTEAIAGPLPAIGSFATEQGSIREQDAIPWYELEFDREVTRVGFIESDDGRSGCSPDGLIGDEGGCEIKCPQRQTHVRYFLKQELPKEYTAQVHASMYFTGRAWWDFVSFCPPHPAFVLRVQRDEKACEQIGKALAAFYEQFDAEMTLLQPKK